MKEIAKILYGSQNYGLDGPASDYDYRIIMMPNFNDFYTYHKINKNDLPKCYEPEHYGVMDVLTFDKNIRNGNIDAIELLFSCDSNINDVNFNFYIELAREAYSEGYVFTVWDTFIRAVEGKIKSTIERYGINNKTVSRALYFINLCHYIAFHDFEIDYNTWRAKEIIANPYKIRYDENVKLPIKEELFDNIDFMKYKTKQDYDYYCLMNSQSEIDSIKNWNDCLSNQMKYIIKTSLLEELK